MNDSMTFEREHALSEDVWIDVVDICRRIPPLWDLPNYVAVNPFLGFAAQPITSAARIIKDDLGADVLPSVSYYQDRWMEGGFDLADLTEAARRRGDDPSDLKRVLEGEISVKTRLSEIPWTYAERHDHQHGTSWSRFLVTVTARWCAVYARKGGAFPMAAGPEESLYGAWLEAARVDRSPEIAGLNGWRAWMKELPSDPHAALAEMLIRRNVAPNERKAYLYRLLGGVYGWASYFRKFSWEEGGNAPAMLLDLLAIRICGDAAVSFLAKPARGAKGTPHVTPVEDENTRMVFQEALEDRFVNSLLAKMDLPSTPGLDPRPAAQAVFCIDVRSEPLRRNLEAASKSEGAWGVQTIGFAGFFGVSLSWRDGDAISARCPVLLKPTVTGRANVNAPAGIGAVLKHLQSAPASSFTFVELAGMVYGSGLIGDAAASTPSQSSREETASFEVSTGTRRDCADDRWDLEARIDLAAGILKNLGLRSSFARLVLFCGHQGDSANNAHAASLACGACGGHSGAINARAVASLLNETAVRLGLRARGFAIPDDTYFAPGLHHTSDDEVALLDMDEAPQTHLADLARLKRWLSDAGKRTRSERAAALGLHNTPVEELGRALRRRASDWSEVRPEWGLAGNAAFIAARRERSREANLEGRAFLHDYDWTTDHDNSVLRLILSAPMVVASWINLQYLASTVDNGMFGCGTKALHNRVDSLGVVLGNTGDLRTGLPLQSVHDSDGRWRHEPLRLQVLVEAPRDRIDAALAAHPDVRDLVENGWVRLFALDLKKSLLSRWEADGWVD